METSRLLTKRGVRSTLLYDPQSPTDASFLKAFDGAFPLVRPQEQLKALEPDLIYAHRLANRLHLRELAQSGIPTVRFLHDHGLFCLREHKYTAFGHKTCTRATGLGCYPCSGGIRRKSNGSLGFARLGALQEEQRETQSLDAVVVASKYMASHAIDHGFDPGRVHVIPLFADSAPENAGNSEVREDFILFVGQLIRGKGLDILLKAMGRTESQAPLLVVGSGRQQEKYRTLVRELGLEDRVTFKGWLPSEEVMNLYRRTSCLVVPSRAPETFGLVGPQAMSQGAPVIASAVGGMEEWLLDGETGLSFPSGDFEALASAIDRVVQDRSFADRVGESGRKRWQERFRPHRHMDALLALFASLNRSVA